VTAETRKKNLQKINPVLQALEKYEMHTISIRFQNDLIAWEEKNSRVSLGTLTFLLLVSLGIQLLILAFELGKDSARLSHY
jgi:hypothetical protein